MNMKLAYLVILAAFLALGYPIGRFVATFRSPSRRLSAIIGLIGSAVFFVGTVAAGVDYRFRILAMSGLCLQVAGLVGSCGSQKKPKQRSLDFEDFPKK